MTAPCLDSAPDFAEALEAWRVWRVIERGGELRLASVVRRTVWPVGEPLVAECLHFSPLRALLRHPHESPDRWCECGIYAAKLARAATYLDDSLPEAYARVLGRVALWGSVVECEKGFRASHAYPIELYVANDAGPRRAFSADEIAGRLEAYGVPVERAPCRRRDLPARLRRAGKLRRLQVETSSRVGFERGDPETREP